MTNEQIKQAAKQTIYKRYSCNGDYPCVFRDECMYHNGHNTSYDCNECGADDFYEGFYHGALWRINSVWHDMKAEEPQVYGEYENRVYPQIPCLVYGKLSTGIGYGVRYWNVTEKCWDDEECDDYECSKDAIEKWAYLDDLLSDRKEDGK